VTGVYESDNKCSGSMNKKAATRDLVSSVEYEPRTSYHVWPSYTVLVTVFVTSVLCRNFLIF
jgi:hypothetical protein